MARSISSLSVIPLGLVLAGLAASCGQQHLHSKHESNSSLGSRTWSVEEDGSWSSRQEWDFMGVEGNLLETPNWEIYTTVENERMLELLPRFYEAALDRYMTSFGELPPPPHSMATYLFGDRRQWKNKTRMMLPELASSFEGLGRGGFTINGVAVLYDIDDHMWDRDTLALAAHEGWHQYAQTTFQQQLPPWLDEGLATTMEGFRIRRGTLVFTADSNRERLYRLREATRNNSLIPLNELLEGDPHEFLAQGKSKLLTYYAQVWAMARFLSEGENERYLPSLQMVLILAVEGDLYRQLLRSDTSGRQSLTPGEVTGRMLVEAFFNDDFEAFTASYDAYVLELTKRNPYRR